MTLIAILIAVFSPQVFEHVRTGQLHTRQQQMVALHKSALRQVAYSYGTLERNDYAVTFDKAGHLVPELQLLDGGDPPATADEGKLTLIDGPAESLTTVDQVTVEISKDPAYVLMTSLVHGTRTAAVGYSAEGQFVLAFGDLDEDPTGGLRLELGSGGSRPAPSLLPGIYGPDE
jgi:type II secretory pathway pseudopilin PulG